uniref:Photosystem I assembly protein Ycf4 n=1 Tax=Pseudobryopsis hainanensis TaxID=2320808 RepID=A0A3S7SXW7_9CHLO|nr:photosystem I assembly protein Ycf4 [Pseudobryopsis hainanensis]
MNTNTVWRQTVIGARRISNFCWAFIVGLGSTGFLITGLASYRPTNILLTWVQTDNILFFPQGLVMTFYGLLGCVFSVYLWLTIFWGVGSGFNEFDPLNKKIRIFRWGFPGKNRRVDLQYHFQDVQGLCVLLKRGFNPQRAILLQLRGGREIPLTRIGQPLTLERLEAQAAELAKILNVRVSTLDE